MFCPSDFLADPAVNAMTVEEVGAYVFLLCVAWESKTRGVLPNDDALLASYSRLGSKWPKHREAILRAFEVRPRAIVQKRMVAEARATDARIARARETGRLGAAVRWGGSVSDDAPPRSVGSASQAHASNSSSYREAPSSCEEGAPVDPRRLVSSLAAGMRMPPAEKSKPTELAWEWLKANAAPKDVAPTMRFAGWLVKTGTRDPEIVLALVKVLIVRRPTNPHAYFANTGTARQSIAMTVAADRAIAEHERVKREERSFLGGKP